VVVKVSKTENVKNALFVGILTMRKFACQLMINVENGSLLENAKDAIWDTA
jgi:hypothetical protein